jgi:hypothetical protein
VCSSTFLCNPFATSVRDHKTPLPAQRLKLHRKGQSHLSLACLLDDVPKSQANPIWRIGRRLRSAARPVWVIGLAQSFFLFFFVLCIVFIFLLLVFCYLFCSFSILFYFFFIFQIRKILRFKNIFNIFKKSSNLKYCHIQKYLILKTVHIFKNRLKLLCHIIREEASSSSLVQKKIRFQILDFLASLWESYSGSSHL